MKSVSEIYIMYQYTLEATVAWHDEHECYNTENTINALSHHSVPMKSKRHVFSALSDAYFSSYRI